MFGCASSPLLHELSLVAGSRGWSVAPEHKLLIAMASLGCMGFSSDETLAWLPRGMWDLPRSGINPVSPALAGGFLTTRPPGKSLHISYSMASPRPHTHLWIVTILRIKIPEKFAQEPLANLGFSPFLTYRIDFHRINFSTYSHSSSSYCV